MERKYIVEGMSCSACSSSVERVVKKLDGVDLASVNLTAKLLIVSGDKISDDAVITAVKKAGFSATVYNLDAQNTTQNNKQGTKQTVKMRLILSIVFLAFLMLVTMPNMFNANMPSFISKTKNPISFIAVQIVLAIPVLILNRKFFIGGVKAVIKKAPNMDTLIALGSSSSFIFGIFAFIMVIIGVKNGDIEVVNNYVNNLYIESSAMILTLVTIGKLLEEKSKISTQSAIEKLKKLAPQNATIIVDEEEVLIDIKDLKVGDILSIKEGESISADCVITTGELEVDEKVLTGESMPVYKRQGDVLKAVTTATGGYARAKVIAVEGETAFSKIISHVLSAQGSKAPIQKLADKVSGVFVPIVTLISIITLIVWLILKEPFDFALSNAISVLVISCPCALGLATPVAVTVAMGKCAENGVLIKNAEVLESLAKIKVAYFDKTGTITKGNLAVSKTYNLDETTLSEVSKIESYSSHLISKAITNYAKCSQSEVSNFVSKVGGGVSATINNKNYKIGNKNFINITSDNILDGANDYINQGKTIVFVEVDKKVLGYIVIEDEVKSSSVSAIKNIKAQGIKTVILSGDNTASVNACKQAVNADSAYGEALPEKKAEIVKNGEVLGYTAFVGDGVNDSLAITTATVGFAVSSGVDVAISFADVVLLKNNLEDVNFSILQSKRTLKIIKQNLFWALIYNVLGIPLAAGVFYFLGLLLNPMIASTCMSISSLFVVLNALRLKK